MNCKSMATWLVFAAWATGGVNLAHGQNFFTPPGGVGNWDDTANWSLSHLPTTGETAYLHAGREATINTANPTSFAYLRIADNDAGAIDGKLNVQPGASLTITNQLLLAAGGPSDNKGVIDQTGGDVAVNDAIFIGYDSAHTGIYNLSNGTLTTGNLWFRFGTGVFTQSGGVVNANQLVLAEGGNPFTSALYDLQAGAFNVSGAANIGKAPGAGDPFAGGSLGSMNISGGVATFGSLLFGTDPTDQVHMSGSGILRVSQANYSEANALANIAAGQITGAGLMVSTYNSGNALYTQISAVPEPATGVLIGLGLWSTIWIACRSRRNSP